MEFRNWFEAQSPPITCRIGVSQYGYTEVHFNVRGTPYTFLVDTGRVKNGVLRRLLKYKPGTAFNELNKDETVERNPPRSQKMPPSRPNGGKWVQGELF